MKKRITNYKVGDIVVGPLYSGQDDRCEYLIIKLLKPGERILGIDDERDHNRSPQDPQDKSYGYLCLNTSGYVRCEPSMWSHGPSTYKVWRDHVNLKKIDSKLSKSTAMVTLNSFKQSAETKVRELKTQEKILKCLEHAWDAVNDS